MIPRNVSEPAATDAAILDWVRRENARRIEEEDSDTLPTLAPVETFPHGFSFLANGTRTPVRQPGTPSTAIETIISQSCCGWSVTPTALEAEAAIKARKRIGIAAPMASTVIGESSRGLIVLGEREQAWSLQDLAWWIHELQLPMKKKIRWLNAMSKEYQLQRARNGRRP